MNRGELAKEYFTRGCNCSQAVLLAFSDRTGLDESVAMRLAAPFGGGMGRMREVCGAVSGMLTVFGILYGYDAFAPTASADKATHYARVQELCRRFREGNGSIVCRELLASHAARLQAEKAARDAQIDAMLSDASTPTPRSADYYRKRPCPELVAYAADLLDAYLAELDAP
ncbi:MAG: C_GCAxxG_C_C family protein [Clostridia bacterium]|nr:C_GCAxxG_C_C family protein [Clostridia bacterium]